MRLLLLAMLVTCPKTGAYLGSLCVWLGKSVNGLAGRIGDGPPVPLPGTVLLVAVLSLPVTRDMVLVRGSTLGSA